MARLDLLLGSGAPHGPFHVALATFEHRTPAALERELADVRERYGHLTQFAGTSVFHAAGRFDVPLVRIVSGAVNDETGAGLTGARVALLNRVTETNGCGHFAMRGLDAAEGRLRVSKPGHQPLQVDVRLAEPGTIKELPPVVLRSGGHALRRRVQ